MEPLRNALKLLQNVILDHEQDLIKGSRKLTLDYSLVCKIKELSEEGSGCQLFNEEVKAEVKSLINVLNNIEKLKISRRSIDGNTSLLDIESFKNLKYLELHNISVDRISGLNSIKSQLEIFICSRCFNYIDVLSDECEWHSLNILALKHGKLVDIGINFFRNCPWLKHLDLSYNNLKNVTGLVALSNLTYLDLSFNCLECVPVLNEKCSKNLQILLISHNYITSLIGIKHYINLRGLDVSNNCLLDRFAIKELFNLSFLQWITLSSNPLSFNPNHRLYAIYNIGTLISPQQFVLDNVALNSMEQIFLGRCNRSRYSEMGVVRSQQTNISGEDDSHVRKQISGLKVSKVREVVIKEESDPEEVDENVLNNVTTNLKKDEEHLKSKEQVETHVKKYGEDKWLLGNAGSFVQDFMGLTKDDNTCDLPYYDILTKASLLRSQDVENENFGIKFSGSSPSGSLQKNEIMEGSPRVSTTVATVHATENTKSVMPKSSQENLDDHYQSNTFESSVVHPNDESSEELFVSATEENVEDGNCSDEKGEDDSAGDEPWWVVQKVEAVNKKIENVFLILLDNELREKNTYNTQITTKWSLEKIQSCVKVKSDPVTIELEFDSVRIDKQSRTYIMEYADAKVLLKRLSSILESRPLSAMNQSTYKCIKCASLFSHQQLQERKQSKVVCPVCNGVFVVEMEEPRLPNEKGLPEKSISHSPSQSSIVFTMDNGCGTGGSGNSMNYTTTPSTTQCSAASLDHSVNSVKNVGTSTPRKYESDIEIISNPSQSSIEVLDEQSRVQAGNTPGRKRSSEERQTIVAVPQLGTVPEILSPNALTESSSSGSMTESVVTTYESQTTINKIVIPEGSVLEEAVEETPCNEGSDECNLPQQLNYDSTEKSYENVGKPKITSEKDMYSYTDYTWIDERVKLFLLQNVIESHENIICLIRCHLWKSGGTDYQACIVLSTESLYILHHTSLNYGNDASAWLSKEETLILKEVKTIFPLVWYQGVGFQIKNMFYLLLLQDRKRTENLLKFFQGLPSKYFKVKKSPNSKVENNLRSALSSSISDLSDDQTITLYTLCSSISIFKDEVCHDTMRLVGLIVTNSGLHITLGDLAWLTGSSNIPPKIHCSRIISCLIEVERGDADLNLHFLDEAEGVEEIWFLKHVTDDEIELIIKAIQVPWEKLFSVPLQVNLKQ